MAGNKRPQGILFDIGGVCVVSPFQAILDYEIANNIPIGWVNYSIQHTSPNGAWHRVERGEVTLDEVFFQEFNRDFQHQHLWKAFHALQQSKNKQSSSSSSQSSRLPPLPKVDAKYLFWEMMRVARSPDPYMFPALRKLQASGQFILGALSNTTILPADNPAGPPVDVKQFFDFFISSAHVGMRKPDPKIYALALKEMNDAAKRKGLPPVEPDDIVFLDDIGINLKFAKKAGFRTIKVDLGKSQDAVRELEKVTGLQLLEANTQNQIPHNHAGNESFLLVPVQLAQHPGSVATRRTKPTGKMPFTKLVKNSAYYSRYQTKFKRRRQGKTDYYARKRLITQAKNKYNAPKYRMVVRFTNRDIITQIVTAEITGDKVFACAYSHELKRYGIEHGLTNWSAAYATGLLLARRTLKKLGLDEDFVGVEEPEGEYSLTEAAETDEGTRRPFKVVLDVGLHRTSTGARVFAAMKGASDGGILIPHSESRFPGYDIETKELDAETLRRYIFGGHVAEYMETLADDDEERYKSQFQKYIDAEIDAGDLEEIYAEAHKAIRADPFKKDEDAGSKKTKEEWKAESLKYRTKKLTRAEKEARVQEKIRELA
ncbi:50S ribosomal protein L5e [Blastomyces dermatitidis ER-3]|uniref:50S ribosomal protein L5e n=1 Tax=Ajellomyces dermatitidis (strain ER-3 / ATCC MYA-2586) TaxID=559297 RepID=A0ABX2VU18_AJEDR|nr:50S ribosomal protein L5e [Blastomyces dermatitidis ER-3]OAT00183.1 50S ribosomal protein L5e [Blastomyces dermatitidis ER-3]